MGHCEGGKGAVNFGQNKMGSPQPRYDDKRRAMVTEGSQESLRTPETQPSNILLSLAEWVENGRAPDSITGVSGDRKTFREHCRYPWKSRWNGTRWICTKDAIGMKAV